MDSGAFAMSAALLNDDHQYERSCVYTTNLRQVGGAIVLTVPPALLDVLHLTAGAQVELMIDCGRLVIAPLGQPRYTLAALLAQCDATADVSPADEQWLAAQPIGSELI